MPIDIVIPWETPGWDEYVGAHSGATVFHTSAWCRIVADVGGYRPLCLVSRDADQITGVLPLMEIRSWLTGKRMGALPFSDECFPIADAAEDVTAIIAAAVALCQERGLHHLEMRGAPILRDATQRSDDLAIASGLFPHSHYNG